MKQADFVTSTREMVWYFLSGDFMADLSLEELYLLFWLSLALAMCLMFVLLYRVYHHRQRILTDQRARAGTDDVHMTVGSTAAGVFSDTALTVELPPPAERRTVTPPPREPATEAQRQREEAATPSFKAEEDDLDPATTAALPQPRVEETQPLVSVEEIETTPEVEPAVAPPPAAPVAELPPVEVEEPKEKPRAKSLKDGLSKTRKGFIARLFGAIGGRKHISGDLLEEVEEILYTADIGSATATTLIEGVHDKADRNELKDPEAIMAYLKAEALDILKLDAPPLDWSSHRPFVLMVVGVNGTGKTTTIGKLAAHFTGQGNHVLLAAGDTFRAAAVEQLTVWGRRTGCEVIHGQEGADPGSVIYNAMQAASARNADILIADTAGRLHTQYNLMEELKKVVRVAKKLDASAPHECWLVLDANTGQNAINQAREFAQAVDVTGIVLTKLDGTAKGGVVLGVAQALKLPIRYIGIGEALEDLRPFDPEAFVDALFTRDTSQD